jgi:hypothetical protein
MEAPDQSRPNGGAMDIIDVLRRIIAGAFLAGFVGVWIWIALKLFRFDPSDSEPKLVLSTAFATVSGALSATVGAGTATVLGIEVQRERNKRTSLRQSFALQRQSLH